MTRARKTGIGILAVFVVIQFFRPARNQRAGKLPADIIYAVPVPQAVAATLKASCYDCHSDNTIYPWYAHIQPLAWYLSRHIYKGKNELNFSEFGSYTRRKQESKIKAIARAVKKGSMPLSSYTLMHAHTRLTDEQKKKIISWATLVQDSLK